MHPAPSIEILRLNPDQNQDIPMPRYMTAHSAGMDICAAVENELVLAPGRIGLVPTGFAMALPDGPVYTAEGTCEGRIGFAARGDHGFGYDPVFIVDGYGGKSLAELEPDVKNRISHRARAVEAALPTLQRLLGTDP